MANLFSIISIVIALTIHEFAHAYSADRLGDPTPRSMGRVSLNPLRHLDPIGTLMLLFGPFGWGKPVQIDQWNFKNPRRDELIVSLAGPLSNIVLAIIAGLLFRFTPINSSLAFNFAALNLGLAFFNLLPIPPLDGSKIFLNLLSPEKSVEWEEAFAQYGTFILIAAIFIPIGGSTIIGHIISPLINLSLALLFG